MLNLLEDVRFAVGDVDLGAVILLVDGGVVVVEMEVFVGGGENGDLVSLGIDAEIGIAGVVPSALVEAGTVWPGSNFVSVDATLRVAVEVVVIHERHACVVEVACAVPDAILLLDAHVAHLHRKEVFEDRLPDSALVDVGSDAKGVRERIAIGDLVHAGFGNAREVELDIFIAKEVAPGRWPGCEHFARAPGRLDAKDADVFGCGVVTVEFNDGELLLCGVVANLAYVDDGLVGPAGDGVRSNDPIDRVGGGACGNQRADDEPAVVALGTGIEELEVGGLGFDKNALRFGLGRDGKAAACGERCGLHFTGVVAELGTIGLRRKDAGGGIEVPGFTEEVVGKEFEVESNFADEGGGNWLVEVDGDADGIAFAAHADLVSEVEVGVVDGIEAGTIFSGVGVRERGGDRVGGLIDSA